MEDRIVDLDKLKEFWVDATNTFALLSEQWNEVQTKKRGLPENNLSTDDVSKLVALEAHLQSQLKEYEFGSSNLESVVISRNSYEPELTNINLTDDSAASDVIRLQWAYLLALLEVGLEKATNHPMFLIFDEPQQQSAGDRDFIRMLQHAASIKRSQIIMGTSHEAQDIATIATKYSIHLMEFGKGRLIKM